MCTDTFKGDTFLHSWEVLAEIISDPVCKDMLVDLGMGVRHRNVSYNCRILCTYKKIFLIRPKQSMANDGLYREMRHFTAWVKPRTVEQHYLEQIIVDLTGQRTVPLGDCVLSTLDADVGCETCEELFVPLNPSTYMGLNGVPIILNSSASHAELRKLHTRLSLIANSTRKLGGKCATIIPPITSARTDSVQGIYVYSNASGIDGDARIMYDASSMVLLNGKVMAQGAQFTLKPVDVITATIDIEEVRSFRSSISRNIQAAAQPDFPRIECDIRLSRTADEIHFSDLKPAREIDLKFLDPMEEMYMAEAVFLWQYLTRANAAGYFLALSGGLDSCTVSVFVYGMARLVLKSIEAGEQTTLDDLRRVTGDKEFLPKRPQEIVNRLLHTCFMGTKHSSTDTRSRAKRLTQDIGAYHSDASIDETINAVESTVEKILDFKPQFAVDGGSDSENLAKQNIQARNRMVLSYTLGNTSPSSFLHPVRLVAQSLTRNLAQLSTFGRRLPRGGSSLLVLSSANVDEMLRGYVTK
jgi:NAD+ synthase (glutamine-hydrolysing)